MKTNAIMKTENQMPKEIRQKKFKMKWGYMFLLAFGSWAIFAPLGFADMTDDLMSAARVIKLKAELMALDFTLDDVEGKRVELDDFRGKVVLLDFWATW